MLKCKVKSGDVSVECAGSLMEIMTETGMLISAIYTSVKRHDERAGLMFMMAVKAMATDISPIWQQSGVGPSVTANMDELLRQMREDGT